MSTSSSASSTPCTSCGGVITGRPAIGTKDPKPWTFVETSCSTRHFVTNGRGTARQWAESLYAGDLVAISKTVLPDGTRATVRVTEVPYLMPQVWRITAGTSGPNVQRPIADVFVSELAHDLDLALDLAQALVAQIDSTQKGVSA